MPTMVTEQARPLAPAAERPSSDGEEFARYSKKIRRQRFIKCCTCLTAFVLILAIVIISLILTVFKVKEPVIKMNGITVSGLELGSNNGLPSFNGGANVSLTADVSVKNPNSASFRYSNTTTALYYDGRVVAEARGPPGQARARRTVRMNVTVDILADRLISSPNFIADVGSGTLTMSSYSRIPGRVKMLNVIKRHIVVKLNCTFTVSISNQSIQDQRCKRNVEL